MGQNYATIWNNFTFLIDLSDSKSMLGKKHAWRAAEERAEGTITEPLAEYCRRQEVEWTDGKGLQRSNGRTGQRN